MQVLKYYKVPFVQPLKPRSITVRTYIQRSCFIRSPYDANQCVDLEMLRILSKELLLQEFLPTKFCVSII